MILVLFYILRIGISFDREIRMIYSLIQLYIDLLNIDILELYCRVRLMLLDCKEFELRFVILKWKGRVVN